VATTERTRAAWDKTRHFCKRPVTNLLNHISAPIKESCETYNSPPPSLPITSHYSVNLRSALYSKTCYSSRKALFSFLVCTIKANGHVTNVCVCLFCLQGAVNRTSIKWTTGSSAIPTTGVEMRHWNPTTTITHIIITIITITTCFFTNKHRLFRV